LNIDPNARFIPPANMQNEVIFDYSPVEEQTAPLPIEGDELIPGNEYIDIPISDGREKVVTESKRFEDATATPKDNSKPSEIPPRGNISTPSADSVSRRKGILKIIGGKQKG